MASQMTHAWGAVAAKTPVFFFEGNNGYAFNGSEVHLHIDTISSPLNFAGELSLQLWALNHAFDNQQLHGHQIATLQLGWLNSGNGYFNITGTVAAELPAGGEYHMVLVLVEKQNGIDYIHDWRGYARTEIFVDTPEIDSPVLPAATVENVTDEDVAEAVAALSKPSAKKEKVKPTKAEIRLNVNTALEADIAALKGVSKQVASHIVASRPIHSLDDLLQIKGIGKKVLERLKALVRI